MITLLEASFRFHLHLPLQPSSVLWFSIQVASPSTPMGHLFYGASSNVGYSSSLLFVEHIRYLGWAKPSMEVGRARSLLGLVLTRVPLPNPLQRAIVECFNQFPKLCSLLRSSRIIYSLLFNFLNKRGKMYALKVDWKHVSSSFKEISCRGAEFSKATFVSFLIFL